AFLRSSGRPLAARLAQMVLSRQIWKPAFRSRVLKSTELNEASYKKQLAEFKSANYLTPKGRSSLDGDSGEGER
ncbi:MAG TPA: hypothetical protein VGG72_17395, partial [Bryobacteraceae bacterium]